MKTNPDNVGVKSLAIYSHPTDGWRTINIIGNVELTDKYPFGLKFYDIIEKDDFYDVRFIQNRRDEALRWSNRKSSIGQLKLCRVPVESHRIKKLLQLLAQQTF